MENAERLIRILLDHFWPIAGTILSAFFVGYISYLNNRINRFATASVAFRNAFSAELAALKNPASVDLDVHKLLMDAFPRHSAAVEVFRHHLSARRQRQFARSWHQFHSGHSFDADKFGIPKKDQLFLEYLSLSEEAEAVSLAIERIETLVAFAKAT